MKKLSLAFVVLTALALPAATSAQTPRAHIALTCSTQVSYPQYQYTSNPPGVHGQSAYSCDSARSMETETCTDQNWGAGWSTISQSCYTTPYSYGTSWNVWDNLVYSYCGRWYRIRVWRYMSGMNLGWVIGSANYRC